LNWVRRRRGRSSGRKEKERVERGRGEGDLFVMVLDERVCTDYEIDSQHTKCIQQHYVPLTKNLDVKGSGLIAELYSKKVLDDKEKDDLESCENSRRRIERFLSILSRKSSCQFEEFLGALDRTQQKHIAKEIRGTAKDSAGFSGTTHLRFVIFVANNCRIV
jgi:hypothetical protein